MKFQELKRGQLFKFGKQKNFRQFLDCHLLNGDNIPNEHKGKMLVIYDNCKQMIADPETEVIVEVNFMEPVKGYGKSYSTGIEKIALEINGNKTSISHFLKDGNRMLYVYCIANKQGEYVDLDVRTINGFPEIKFDEMMKSGIDILQNHISENPNAYAHLL
jgi:hypothetical protein